LADHDKHDDSSAGHSAGGHGATHAGGHEEHHEGAPEWLISFADNVALMMGFFVILLAMNMAKKTAGGIGGEDMMGNRKTAELDFVLSLREAFNPIDLESENPSEAALRARKREKIAEGQRSRQPEESGKGRESSAIRPTDLSTLGGTIAFEDDSSSLSDKGTQLVEKIAAKLAGQRFIIEVRGHASPSETMRNREKGMTLSNARAMAVARVLVATGIRWEQLRVVACGDNERKVGRTYDDSDRINQRVNIVPTNEVAPDAAPAAAPEGAQPGSAAAPDHG
jgi:flagellar motor protein MotB